MCNHKDSELLEGRPCSFYKVLLYRLSNVVAQLCLDLPSFFFFLLFSYPLEIMNFMHDVDLIFNFFVDVILLDRKPY